jgi:hypothetical protein
MVVLCESRIYIEIRACFRLKHAQHGDMCVCVCVYVCICMHVRRARYTGIVDTHTADCELLFVNSVRACLLPSNEFDLATSLVGLSALLRLPCSYEMHA